MPKFSNTNAIDKLFSYSVIRIEKSKKIFVKIKVFASQKVQLLNLLLGLNTKFLLEQPLWFSLKYLAN